ncbi:MAG: putative rane protein [Archaeoglobi archaeon]|nr:putative rane protein [Archaeoglobi archaeon]MDK2781836.1 putative rane protein [Archaeoglobi archaeon]
MMEMVFAFLLLIGSVAAALYVDPIDKILMLTIASGGLIGFTAFMRMLDVAIASSILIPVSTIILLIGLIRLKEVKGDVQ